jgi:hypothetical protein
LKVETMVVSLFCTSEQGALIQDSFPTPDDLSTFLGIEVPYHYFVRKSEMQAAEEEAALGMSTCYL